MFGCRVGVGAEVAYALELHGLPYGYVAQRRLQVARDLDHGFGVEVVLPGLPFVHVVGVLLREERVEQADFSLHGIFGRYPVDDALHAAAVARRPAARHWVVGAAQLGDVARGILDDLLAKEQQAKEAAEGVLEQIDLIKKAILARAFRGELGTNDPGEENAVELLKVIV